MDNIYSFSLFSLYCPDYWQRYVVLNYNNSDIFAHRKNPSVPNIFPNYSWVHNFPYLIGFHRLKHKKWNKCPIEAHSEVIKTCSKRKYRPFLKYHFSSHLFLIIVKFSHEKVRCSYLLKMSAINIRWIIYYLYGSWIDCVPMF